MGKSLALGLGMWLLLSLSQTPAHATLMLALDLSQLADRADQVVLATVEKTEARWTDSHDSIFTEVTLRVSKVYKGAVQPGGVVVVRREGGSVNGIAMRVFGSPQFVAGEEAVVFAQRRGGSDWVVGMSQGKLRVVADATGRRLVSPPDLSGVSFLKPETVPPQRTRALDEFEQDLAGVLSSSRPRK